MVALSQASVERLLTRALEAAGGAVERGVRMVECRNLADGGEVSLEHADGTREIARCPCLLAADGARSVVRQQLGIDFPGAAFARDWHLADAPLRDEGVLVIGSGNVVHNLHTYAWGQAGIEPFDWAVRFEKRVRELLLAGDHAPLIDYGIMGRDATLSVPTPEHYLPLLYVLALRGKDEQVSFPVEGMDGGSVSMLTARLG